MEGSKDKAAYSAKSTREEDTRLNNILAAKTVSDLVRTSLGPRGMDKMIQNGKGEVLITNDGATILKQIEVVHPTAKMLVEISKAQDIEAGDGTTSVVVLAGALLNAASLLMEKGIHPTSISDGFQIALHKGLDIVEECSIPIDLNDREALIKNATTALASKVVAQHSEILAPMAADAVMRIVDKTTANNVDLRNIKVQKKIGGTMDDSELVEGLIFTENRPSHSAGGPTKIANAKIGLVQFCISGPKTDMDHNIEVKDYATMDRVIKQERRHILSMVKKIADTGCNVLLIQKSILRDAVTELSLHFLAKKHILVLKDIEREDVEFISETIGATPVAHIDNFTVDKLGKAQLVEEINVGGERKVTRVTGVPGNKTVTILLRGSNQLMIEEADRSFHDALCVVRSLVKKRSIVAGGSAIEIELATTLSEYARELVGVQQYIVKAYADALEVIPYTLAENAGLHPINIVTELRNLHAKGGRRMGIDIRKGMIADTYTENVIQPSLVTTSALTLATECVRMILKIDDIVLSR